MSAEIFPIEGILKQETYKNIFSNILHRVCVLSYSRFRPINHLNLQTLNFRVIRDITVKIYLCWKVAEIDDQDSIEFSLPLVHFFSWDMKLILAIPVR